MNNLELLKKIIKLNGFCDMIDYKLNKTGKLKCSDCPLEPFKKEGCTRCSTNNTQIKKWANKVYKRLKIKTILND